MSYQPPDFTFIGRLGELELQFGAGKAQTLLGQLAILIKPLLDEVDLVFCGRYLRVERRDLLLQSGPLRLQQRKLLPQQFRLRAEGLLLDGDDVVGVGPVGRRSKGGRKRALSVLLCLDAFAADKQRAPLGNELAQALVGLEEFGDGRTLDQLAEAAGERNGALDRAAVAKLIGAGGAYVAEYV